MNFLGLFIEECLGEKNIYYYCYYYYYAINLLLFCYIFIIYFASV